ncbi:unnamed protein product [Brassicogethes aeneus]|uniref:non-specific serine/threonine protein kinase n=1 Tax=Brassicogethes aeneus TaxID=1431903 RepID=A0A9P0B644_BRAAE|nr:unnamed protein product [Brassicogethes aeneus]
MDKYDILGSLGEGSFGRVYKAKRNTDGIFVALKVISKRGRSVKELKGFRRECEIQRDLNHPNVIKMLDSFETDNEIVVITEFAHKELNKLLGKTGYLSEDKVQPIVWDLVSALFYLHSNRVLHRDLKPQNILIDAKNHAKLCDFGFARNMSTGTHVLTSIKGTPLYMAPELMEEQPYDFKADLWSLGCIIYELLVGTPPFCTNSILHLIRLIRHEEIQWPTFISENCISFLKGLLQKNPAKRMAWDQILSHSFVKSHIYICKSIGKLPLTSSSPIMCHAKQQQKMEILNKKRIKTGPVTQNIFSSNENKSEFYVQNNNSMSDDLKKLSLKTKNVEAGQANSTDSIKTLAKVFGSTANLIEDNHPIESDEWIVFLKKNIQEIQNGEMTSLTQAKLASIIVSPLRNNNSSPKVLTYIARLMSIPFVLRGVMDDMLNQIQKVYLEVKLVPNLVYASKLLLKNNIEDNSCTNTPSPSYSPLPSALENYKQFLDLSEDDLEALEYIFLLISHLIYKNDEFIMQFCDSVVVLNVYVMLKLLLLIAKKNIRIVLNTIAVLIQMLRKSPENQDIIEKILLNESNHQDLKPICFVELLRHNDYLLRERTCFLLLFMCRNLQENTIRLFWNEKVRETLEALMFDSIDTVRNAAEVTVEDLKQRSYYNTIIE